MRRTASVIAWIAATLSSKLPASAQTIGNWRLTQVSNGCMMTANYNSGIEVSVVVNFQYQWGIGLANPRWRLEPKSTTPMALKVDGRPIANDKAKHLDRNLMLIPLATADQYKALQAGYLLDIATPYGNWNFRLTDTARAMAAVLDCVNKGQPGPPQREASSGIQHVPAEQVAVFLTNLLNAAGAKGYVLEAPTDSSGLVSFKLADGTLGSLQAWRGNTITPDERAGHVVQALTQACKGDFASTKQSVPSTDGSVTRKLITTCKMGDTVMITETTLVRHSDGLFLSFVLLPPLVAAPPAPGAPTTGDALLNAVMTQSKGQF